MNPADIIRQLAAQRLIPVLRLDSQAASLRAIEALMQAGFGTVEVTLTTPGAVALIASLHERAASDFLIGAGTVLSAAEAEASLEAGAHYLVAPSLVAELAPLAHARGRACLLGAFTPTEVTSALRMGADAVKIFPAASGGPSHLAALRAVFPQVPLCPTGGVSLDNMAQYFKAGANFVGVGNNIIDREALAAGDMGKVQQLAARYLQAARAHG